MKNKIQKIEGGIITTKRNIELQIKKAVEEAKKEKDKEFLEKIETVFDKIEKEVLEHVNLFGEKENRDIDIREKFVLKMLPIVIKNRIKKELKNSIQRKEVKGK